LASLIASHIDHIAQHGFLAVALHSNVTQFSVT